MHQRYGLVLVPRLCPGPGSPGTAADVIEERARDGWQLVSAASDRDGSDVLVFRQLG